MRPILSKLAKTSIKVLDSKAIASKALSSSERFSILSINQELQKVLEKPIDKGIPTYILDLMMKKSVEGQVESVITKVSSAKTIDALFPRESRLYENLQQYDPSPGQKIITPIVIDRIKLSPQVRQKFNLSHGTHMILSVVHIVDRNFAEIFLVDNNGMNKDDFFQIGGIKGLIQKSAKQACVSSGLKIVSVKSNLEPTHKAPAICGIASVHNVAGIAKEMESNQSLSEFFEQRSKDGGIPEPLILLDDFRKTLITKIIEDNKELLAKSSEHSKSAHRG